ncbi:Methionine adenosyltransferase 2 subunit beta [Mactra antiquata]
MANRVMVTGASGLLGRAIMKEFKSSDAWNVIGLAFSRSGSGLKKVDISDKNAVIDAVNEFKPQIIIHSAAERRVDVMERDPVTASKINLDGTENICEAAKSINAWVLFISTDYVFDGTSPPYKVTDQPNPLNLYGKSKAEGEKITLAVNKDNAVLRVPVLYGCIETLNESAVTCLLAKVKDTSCKAGMDGKQIRFPTHCDDVAYVIKELSNRQVKDKNIEGIYHWSNDEKMTKYDMAVTMGTVLGLSTDHIEKDMSGMGGASRPDNAQLDCSRVEQLGIVKRTKYSSAIGDVLKSFT